MSSEEKNISEVVAGAISKMEKSLEGYREELEAKKVPVKGEIEKLKAQIKENDDRLKEAIDKSDSSTMMKLIDEKSNLEATLNLLEDSYTKLSGTQVYTPEVMAENYNSFVEEIRPEFMKLGQQLKEKLDELNRLAEEIDENYTKIVNEKNKIARTVDFTFLRDKLIREDLKIDAQQGRRLLARIGMIYDPDKRLISEDSKA